MAATAKRPDPAVLLQAEHDVARVLAQATEPARAYPLLLEALGVALGWELGAAWELEGDALRCEAVWRAGERDADRFERAAGRLALKRGEGLPGRVWASGRPARAGELDGAGPRHAAVASRAGLRSAFCFPVRGVGGVIGAIELFGRQPQPVDRELLATVGDVGRNIGQYLERGRAQKLVRESNARMAAILDAAFDCIIVMDAEGRVVEVNRATEQTFGYRAEQMVGADLAELIVPPELRELHRRGVRRYVRTGRERIDHPLELTGVRADGTRFPVELAITRPNLEGTPLFTGYLRDITHRRRAEDNMRALVQEQAALRRVATAVASESDQRRVFSAVAEEVGRLLGAQSANLLRFEDGPSGSVLGGWSAEGTPSVAVGERVPLDGPTSAALVYRTGRPARVDSYDELPGDLAQRLRGLGFRCAVAAPVTLAGRLWGAVIVSSVTAGAFAPGAEHRIGEFAELVAQAVANAEAREQLAASRARLVRAADAERRRLERNLHDGAQQRLVALSLSLRVAERRVSKDPPGAAALLEQAGAELDQALGELRELARGLHPAILSDRGLEPALGSLAERAPLPVQVAVGVDVRLRETVEAAAYYVVAEALTNVAKYARANEVHVGVTCDDGRVTVRVTDDGVGGAAPGAGTGLRGLADRVEALGGTLEVESPAGRGTTVCAEMPA